MTCARQTATSCTSTAAAGQPSRWSARRAFLGQRRQVALRDDGVQRIEHCPLRWQTTKALASGAIHAKLRNMPETNLEGSQRANERIRERLEPPDTVVSSVVLTRTSPSSRGLGRGPFKAKTRVRIPLGTPPLLQMPFGAGYLRNRFAILSWQQDSTEQLSVVCLPREFNRALIARCHAHTLPKQLPQHLTALCN